MIYTLQTENSTYMLSFYVLIMATTYKQTTTR